MGTKDIKILRVSQATSLRDLSKLLGGISGEWYLFIASISMLAIASWLSTIVPIIIRDIIDFGIAQKRLDLVVSKSLYILALSALAGVLRLGSGYTGSLMAQRIVHKLRSKAFEKLVYQPIEFFDSVAVGHAITRVINDSDRVSGFLSFGLRMLLNALFLIALSMYYMLSMNIILSVLCVVAIAVIITVNALTAIKLRPAVDTSRQQLGILASITSSNITGIKTVKGLGLEKVEENKFSTENSKLLSIGIDIAKKRSIYTNISFLVFGIILFTILLYGGYMVINKAMSVGMLTAFFSYIVMLMWPTSLLGFILFDIQLVTVSVRRIFELIDSKPELGNDSAMELNNIEGEVVFENVSFSYTGGSYVLKDLSFCISPGEKVVIVGPPGSGKSTILKLMLGFYKPTIGRILIDGIDIAKVKSSSLRKFIGYVPQVPFIFSTTIAENIAFGKADVTLEEIANAARLAKIDDFIESLPNKYNTIVGERGVNLSGGQRQRIAIARALIYNPKILLLDDPTSNLDAETEKNLIEDLKEIAKGRTLIIVTQRPTLAEIADRVLVLDSGRIVEEGSMQELLDRKGLFYRMYVSMVGFRGVSVHEWQG